MDKKKIISTDKAEAVCGGRPDNSPRPAGRQQVCPFCHQLYVPGDGHDCQSIGGLEAMGPFDQWSTCPRCGKRYRKPYGHACKA